jgi:hypothetical protein
LYLVASSKYGYEGKSTGDVLFALSRDESGVEMLTPLAGGPMLVGLCV